MGKLEGWKKRKKGKDGRMEEWKDGKDGGYSLRNTHYALRITFHVSRFTFCLFACWFGFMLSPASIDAAGFSTSGRGILYTIESIDALTDAVTRQPDGSYQMTSSITIANQTRPDILQLSPGVTLRFAKGSTLQVDGTLIAVGTKAAPITFTSIGEEWNGIVFSQSTPLHPPLKRGDTGGILGAEGGEACVIENARIENAHIGISCQNASPRIASVHISHCKTYAIAIASAKPIIHRNHFSNHRASAVIYSQSASPEIIDNHFELTPSQTGIILIDSDAHVAKNRFRSGGSAISCRASSPKIENNEITGASIAISGLQSDFVVTGNRIADSSTGIYVDGGQPTMRSNHIHKSSVAAISLWDLPQGTVSENIIEQSKIGVYSKGANLTIDQNQFQENDYAIYIKEGSAQIRRNILNHSAEAGIAFWAGATGEAMDNDIRDSRYGVYAQNSSPTIRQNQIAGGEYGIRIQSASPQIAGNRISDASEGGIGCWDANPEIESNTITQSRYGIYCDNASPLIAQNTLIDSRDAGVAGWNGSRPNMRDNTISGGRYEVFRDALPSGTRKRETHPYPSKGGDEKTGQRSVAKRRAEGEAPAKPVVREQGEGEAPAESVVRGQREGEAPAEPAIRKQAEVRMEEGKVGRVEENKAEGRKVEDSRNGGRMEEGKDARETAKQGDKETTHQPSNLPPPQSSNLPTQSSDTGTGPSSLFNAAEQETLRRGQRANPPTETTRHTTYQLRQMQPGEGGQQTEEGNNKTIPSNLPTFQPSNPQPQAPDAGYHSTDNLPAPRLPQGVKGPSLNREQSSRLMTLEEMLGDDSIDINEKIAKQFEVGQLYFKGGKYQQALDAYNWILTQFAEQMKKHASGETHPYPSKGGDGKNNRELANIHYHCALSYYELKNYASAVNSARTCLNLNPEPAVKLRAQYTLAMSAMQNHASQMAEKAFLELVKELEERIGKGEHSHAERGNEEDSPLTSLLSSAYFQLGRLAVERRAYREAAEHYSNALVHGIGGEQRAETLSELGYCALQASDRESAIRWYQKLIEEPTAHSGLLVPAFLALGDGHREAREWKQAEPFYRSARQHADAIGSEQSVRGEIAFKLGESLYSQARFFEAISAFEDAISLAPKAPWGADAAYGLATSQAEMDNSQAALNAYRRAADGYAQLIRTTSDSSTWAQAQERLARSKFQIAELTAKNAASKRDYENLLTLYREARQASEGVQDETLRAALQKDALVSEAKAAEQLGLTDTINQTALMLAAASRNDPLGLMQAADVLFDQGQYGGAAGLYRQAIGLWNEETKGQGDKGGWKDGRACPERSEGMEGQQSLLVHGWMRLGFCHFQLSQQNVPQRDENLRQAIEADEQAIAALQSTIDNQQKFVVEESKGTTPEGKEVERAARPFTSSNLPTIPPSSLQSAVADLNNARYHAAVAHQLLGEYEPALKLFEKVAETDETEQFRSPSLLALGELYEKEKRYDEAIRAYEGASLSLKEPQGVALALQRISEISRLLGKYDTAIHSYQELLKRYPQSEYAPAAQYFIGVCYANAENKNIDLALAAYEKVIQNYPDSELAIDAYWNAATLSDPGGNKSKAFHYAQQLLNRYAQSKDAHAQEIVYSARNLISNLLLADATLHPNGAAVLTQQLTAIASASEATPEARANAYFELGNLHANAKDYQSAQVDYQNAKQASNSDELRTKIGYREATLHFALGEYAKAVETGLETLQRINQSTSHQSPVTSHLYYMIGQSQMELNQIDAAMEAFQQAIGVATDGATMPEINPFSHFYLGQIHERRGKTDQAIAEYQVVLSTIEASPNDPKAKEIRTEAARHLARIYENGEMSKSANEQMSKSADESVEGELPTGAGGNLPSHSRVRQEPHPPPHQQALELYAQVIAADVNPRLTAEAIYRRGLIYQRADEPDKAMAEFSQLVNRFSKTSDAEIKAMVEDAILRLPKLSSSSGDVDSAIQTAKAALQLAQNKADPLTLAQAQFQLASLYHQTGDKKQQQSAVKLFKEAYTNALKSENVTSPSPAFLPSPQRGGAGGEVRNEEEQRTSLINAAMFQAGQAAYQSGDPQGAIQPLEDFIQRFPEDEKVSAAYEYLAWSYFTVADKTQSEKDRSARFRSAAEAFNQLVARNTNPEKTPEWMYQSAQALTLARETAKASAAYQKLVETYPAHALAEASLYTVGGMQFASKQYDEALKTYQRVVEQYPEGEWIDESLYAIAAAYDALKQGEKAVQAYQAVIERFPNQPVAVNAQANIGHYYFNHNAYARALEAYNKLTPKNFPGMDAKLRSNADRWKVDTENIMAETPYKDAVALLAKADTGAETPSDEEKRYALTAIGQFEKLIKDYPNSAYIDHALVSIGTAYEIRAEWEDALNAYSRLAARHQKTPTDANLQKLLDYAQGRTQAIKVFLLQKEKFGK